jgi:chemotaxis signal transduction protein
MIGLLVDRVLDAVAAPSTRIVAAPTATPIERLDFASGIGTIDNVMIALIALSNLLSQPIEMSGGKASTH